MKHLTVAIALTCACAVGSAASPSAAGRDLQISRGSDQVRLRVTDRQLQQILATIRTDAEALRRGVQPASRQVSNEASARASDVTYAISDLVDATDQLDNRVTRRQETRADVEDVLGQGSRINRLVTNETSFQAASRTAWTRLQRDLGQLASAYDLPWNANDAPYSSSRVNSAGGGAYERLSGTYELDRSRSDDPNRAADRVLGRLSATERTRLQRQVENRLNPPDVISFDRQGDRFTLASSTGPRTTFTADGQSHSEPNANGRNVTTRAALNGDQLEVRRTGNRGTDFTVTFEPLNNGDSLRITRQLFNDTVQQPITVQSVYRRTSPTADWNVYDQGTRRTAVGRASSNAVVPEGTTLVATLDQPLDVRSAHEGQRVSLTVQDAAGTTFDGAVIQGFVTGTPSNAGDRTGLGLDFDQIRMRNGRTADFAGTIEGIRDPDGRPIDFDTSTADDSQNDQMLKRGAIGAALGAIVGAIAGGGKGAAIGAAVGAGGGAGTVLIENRGQLNLPRSTEFTIQSRTPNLRQ